MNLTFYLLSMVISVLSNSVLNIILKENIENKHKIFRKKEDKIKKYINVMLLFIPYINIFKMVIKSLITISVICSDKIFNAFYKDSIYSPIDVKRVFEENEEELLLKEINKQINKQFNDSQEISFTLEDYERAKVYIYEINNDIKLTSKERMEMVNNTYDYDIEKYKKLTKKS